MPRRATGFFGSQRLVQTAPRRTRDQPPPTGIPADPPPLPRPAGTRPALPRPQRALKSEWHLQAECLTARGRAWRNVPVLIP